MGEGVRYRSDRRVASIRPIDLTGLSWRGPNGHAVALARNLAMYLARKHTGLSFPEIGRLMGNKDHTTVLLACRRLTKVLELEGAVNWLSAAGPQTAPLRELLQKQEEQLVR